MVAGSDSENQQARDEIQSILSRMIGKVLKEQTVMKRKKDGEKSSKDQAKKLREYAKKRGIEIEILSQHLSREELENLALEEVCACRYYDLQDTLQETPDEDLMLIINHTVTCEVCGK